MIAHLYSNSNKIYILDLKLIHKISEFSLNNRIDCFSFSTGFKPREINATQNFHSCYYVMLRTTLFFL